MFRTFKTFLTMFLLSTPIFAARLSGGGSGSGIVSISTLTAGATNFIWNTSTLQSGATFYTSSGTALNLQASSLTVTNYSLFQNVSTTTFQNVTKMKFSDGVMLDMTSVNDSDTNEGLFLPQTTNCVNSIGEGQVCWDTDDDILYIGGSAAKAFIGSQNTLQSGATFYVSSGTINTQLTIVGLTASQFVKTGSGKELISSSITASDLPSGSTLYIQNTSSLQTGATFYVSSGTINGKLTVSTITFKDADGSNFIAFESSPAVTLNQTYIIWSSTGMPYASLNVGPIDSNNKYPLSFGQRLRTSYVTVTSTSNTAATETNAFSHTIGSNTLAVDGNSLDYYAGGTFAGTAATDKRIRVYFSTSVVFDSGNLAITSSSDWSLRGSIVRVNDTSQKCIGNLSSNFSTITSTADYTTNNATLSSDNNLKITISGTNASDVVLEFYKEIFSPGTTNSNNCIGSACSE